MNSVPLREIYQDKGNYEKNPSDCRCPAQFHENRPALSRLEKRGLGRIRLLSIRANTTTEHVRFFFPGSPTPHAHIHLGIGSSGTHAQQTGKVMIAYEKILMDTPPDLVIVVGDVNSTMAATIAAVKLGIKMAHLEAGLRSLTAPCPKRSTGLSPTSLTDFFGPLRGMRDENLV